MRRKSKPSFTPTELDFLKEKNKALVKELVEHKNSRKQFQLDFDYMVKEKFIADQKLLRLEKVCSEVKLKTKSCLDKIVDCSEDLTEIFGLLERINKIKRSQHILEAESANLTELRNLSSNQDVQKSRIQNEMKNSYEDTTTQKLSLTSKADRTVHSGNNLGNVTMTNATEELLNTDGRTMDNSHSPENVQESSSLHESSFVSRGGRTVISETGNLDMTDFESETEMYAEDDMEDQTNLTPAGKALSIIQEDWEESRVSDGAERPTGGRLRDVSSLMTLGEVESVTHNTQNRSNSNIVHLERISRHSDFEGISTYVEPSSMVLENSMINTSNLKLDKSSETPKRSSKDHSTTRRLSYIKRKSIGSPLPAFNGSTILRKSGGKQRSLSGAKKRLSLGETHTPLLEMTNPPASSTLLEDRTSAPPLLETTLKAPQDLSYMPELPKNTSTPIQSTLPSRSRNGKKIARTICDEESGTDFDPSINKTSPVREKNISSYKSNDTDPDDITLRCSKRRRCPTFNPLQKFIEKSLANSRGTVKMKKIDSYVDPELSIDEQTVESLPKISNTSINKKTIAGASGKQSARGTKKQAADLRSVEKPRNYSESSEQSDINEDLSDDTMVLNSTSFPPKKNTNQSDNTPKFSKKRKCEETEDTARSTNSNTFDRSEPSEDKQPNTEVADKRKRRKYPSSKPIKKLSKKAKISEEDESSKMSERESLAVKIVQNQGTSQEDTSDLNISVFRRSSRPKKSPENLLQKYIDSSKRAARKAKPTCLKEPKLGTKLRRC